MGCPEHADGGAGRGGGRGGRDEALDDAPAVLGPRVEQVLHPCLAEVLDGQPPAARTARARHSALPSAVHVRRPDISCRAARVRPRRLAEPCLGKNSRRRRPLWRVLLLSNALQHQVAGLALAHRPVLAPICRVRSPVLEHKRERHVHLCYLTCIQHLVEGLEPRPWGSAAQSRRVSWESMAAHHKNSRRLRPLIFRILLRRLARCLGTHPQHFLQCMAGFQ